MLHRFAKRLKRFFRPTAPGAEHPWVSLANRNAARGLGAPLLFLSFDCDTDLDIPAARTLAYRLRERGMESAFAVPGAQLMRGAETFRGMAGDGFEFLNHGARPHARWDGEKYVPVTFYGEMSLEEVAHDIREGDRMVREVTGKAPLGFRAPHFGCFQAPEQIAFMHQICGELGYVYASTTMPALGLEHGSWFHSQGICEIPLTGSWREPLNIPDSWSNLSDRRHFALDSRFAELWRESLNAVLQQRLPLILCWYVDPAHVIDQQAFDETMTLLCASGIRFVTGAECARLTKVGIPAVEQ